MSQSSKIWVVFGILVTAIAVGWGMHKLDNTTSANAADPTASPSASATVATTPTPNPGDKGQPPAPSAVCRLSVIGPWSEINGANPYRIEVGGGDTQHMDFYPTIGVQSISYIVPPLPRGGVAAKWYGYGQMWQGNKQECANFDFVKDAVDYARGNATGQPGRLQQGHSGIVIDLRGGDFKIVEKPAGWSDDQINALIALHKAAMNPANPPGAGSVQAPSGKCEAVRVMQDETKRPNGANSIVKLGGDGHAYVFELWNPEVQGGKEMKVLIPAGESRTFTGFGGAAWQYPTTCTAQQVKDDFDKNPKPAYTG